MTIFAGAEVSFFPRTLSDEFTPLVDSLKGASVEQGTATLDTLTALIKEHSADSPHEVLSLFYRDNPYGRYSLSSLFYGDEDERDLWGPSAAANSGIRDRGYRKALKGLQASLDALVPGSSSTVQEKRVFWESVKVYLPAFQTIDDAQALEVVIHDLNSFLRSYYGTDARRSLKVYTYEPESLSYPLLHADTVAGTNLDVRSVTLLEGNVPDGAQEFHTLNGTVWFV